MSATLHIVLDKWLNGSGVNAAALAQVVPLDRRRNKDDPSPLVIPAGSEVIPAKVSVEPGVYLVQATLPSGELIDMQVEVAEGEEKEVKLLGHRSPHEWLGWQHLISSRVSDQEQSVDELGFETLPPPPRVAVTIVDQFPTKRWRPLSSRPFTPFSISPSTGDDQRVAFELQGRTAGGHVNVVKIEQHNRLEVVFAPAHWVTRHKDNAVIQLVVPFNTEQRLALAVQDPDLGAFLGYIANGALPTAARLLAQGTPVHEACMAAIEDRVENPLMAAMGAYVMLNTTRKLDPAPWNTWLQQLYENYRLPDFLALRGLLEWQYPQHQGQSGVSQAHKLFLSAFEAGTPACTPIFRLLLECLIGTANGHPNTRDAIADFQEMATRLDLAQPFTTLRFQAEDFK